jgi:D-sedoheptulose 7-phosphate isomerase
MAYKRGLFVFGLLGRDGGELYKRRLCDEAIVVPSDETPHIQECHIMLIHILCDFLDQHFVLADSVDFLHGT